MFHQEEALSVTGSDMSVFIVWRKIDVIMALFLIKVVYPFVDV